MRLREFALLLLALACAPHHALALGDTLYAADERPFIQVDTWDAADYSVTATFSIPGPPAFRQTATAFFKRNPRLVPDPKLKNVRLTESISLIRDEGPKYWMSYNFLFTARPLGNVIRATGQAGLLGTANIVVPGFEDTIIVPWNETQHTETLKGITYTIEVRWK